MKTRSASLADGRASAADAHAPSMSGEAKEQCKKDAKASHDKAKADYKAHK